jgi:hypothetical protein
MVCSIGKDGDFEMKRYKKVRCPLLKEKETGVHTLEMQTQR